MSLRSIVAFRHGHDFNFGCSDIYIIVALRPTSSHITFDEKEISACQWMPLDVRGNKETSQRYKDFVENAEEWLIEKG